jgi:hypothetical protein
MFSSLLPRSDSAGTVLMEGQRGVLLHQKVCCFFGQSAMPKFCKVINRWSQRMNDYEKYFI